MAHVKSDLTGLSQPGSQIDPITPEQRQSLLQASLVAGVYEKTVDRKSAYENCMNA